MDIYPRFYEMVSKIPYGKVASYGQVAKAAGFPRGAQMVGWALRGLPADTEIPWQRVVAMGGKVTIVNPKLTKMEQVRRLRDEGIKIEEQHGWYVVADPEAWHSFTETHEKF